MPFVIQIDAWDAVAAAAVTLRLSSVDDERVCHVNGQTWLPAIDALPTLAMDFFGGEFGVVSTPRSTFSMMTGDWPNFGRYTFVDARMQMWQGDAGAAWGSYVLRFDGRISADPEIEDQRATLSFGVDDRWLDQPLLATYAGTGGIEGRAEQKGAEKPLALGAPQGVPGVLLDPVKWIYQLHAYGAVEGVDVPLERLARQFGSPVADHANYAALDAATVAAGQWATCKASGLVRMGAPPYGKLCFLMRGDKGGVDGWVRRAGAQIKRIAAIAGYAAKVNEASVDALDAARPYDLSLYFGSQQSVREAVQAIAASVNAVAGVSLTGELITVAIGINAAALTLQVDGSGDPPVASCRKLGMDAPWWRLSIGAQPFWLVHGDGDYVTYDVDPATQAALDILAAATGKVTYGGPLPSAANSSVGDLHVGDDGTFYERVGGGGILLDGKVVVLAGYRPVLPWTLTASQPLRDTIATANEAYTNANAAIDQLIGLADDGIISINEKITKLIPEQARLDEKYTVLAGQATGLAVSTTAAAAAKATWDAMLAGLSPAWNNITADSPVVRATFDAARNGFDSALYDLDAAIKTKAATIANWSGIANDNGNRPDDGATRNAFKGDYAGGTAYVPGDTVVWTVASGGTGAGYTRIGTGSTIGTAPSDGTKWALFVERGAQGPQGDTGAAGGAGPQGPPGDDGVTLYSWIAYADSADGATNFTTGASGSRTYIGIANNKTTATESTNPADYTWSKIRGDDGVAGTPGADGITTYTWFAYADSADGATNFTTGTPGARTYLGLAANKTTTTESTDPADYFWSKIQGPQGVAGTDGTDGVDGTDGKLVEWVFIRSLTQPATPTGNGIPAGWSDDAPNGDAPLWASSAKQELDGTLVSGGAWATPFRFNETDSLMVQAELPAWNSVKIGQRVMLPDGLIYKRVASVGILLDGKAIVLAGYRPRLPWTLESTQPVAAGIRYGLQAIDEAQSAADAALIAQTLANDAQATADGKIQTYYQATAPSSASEGDIWIDTDDGNNQYRRTSGAWVDVQDTGIGQAIADAAGAQATADGKVTTFIGETAPTADAIGDLWLKASSGQLRRWSGTSWGDPLADLTAVQQVVIVPPVPQIVYRDWQGNIKSGQYNRILVPKVERGGVDIRDDDDVTYAISTTGSIAATVNNTTASADKGKITATDGSSGSIILTVTVAGVSFPTFTIPFTNQDDNPPTTGGGSGNTGGSDSTLEDVTSTSFATITQQDGGESVFLIDITSGQTLNGTAPLTYQKSGSNTTATALTGKWQYRLQGDPTWLDFAGSSITGTGAYWNDVDFSAETGDVTINQSKASLATGTYEVQLVAAKSNSAAGNLQIILGTATVSRT